MDIVLCLCFLRGRSPNLPLAGGYADDDDEVTNKPVHPFGLPIHLF